MRFCSQKPSRVDRSPFAWASGLACELVAQRLSEFVTQTAIFDVELHLVVGKMGRGLGAAARAVCAQRLMAGDKRRHWGRHAEAILDKQGCAYGCKCRGTWSHYAFFCPHGTPMGYRKKWLGKVQAVRALTEPEVGDACETEVAAALCGGIEFESPLQCIQGLLSVGVAGALGGYLDFYDGFALEPAVRAIVGSLVSKPREGEGTAKVTCSKLKSVAKPMIVAGLELLEQARRDDQVTVDLIRDEGARRRGLQWHLVAWRNVLRNSGPARREALRSLHMARRQVYDTLGDELVADERDGWSYLAALSLLSEEATRIQSEIRASYVLLGPMAALHWRLALLVRRWRARRARLWERKWELGPCEYAVCTFVTRLHVAAGCRGAAPRVELVAAVDMDGALVRWWSLLEGWWGGSEGPLHVDVGWEGRLARAGREWWRHDTRRGWLVALRELRAERAAVRYAQVEAGECAGFGGRWRTKRVVDARLLPSGGAVAMVEWPNPRHADEEVRLIDLTTDERAVAWRIIHSRQAARKVARMAVRAVVARAAAETLAARLASGQLDRRSGRLAEVAAATAEAPARAVVASLVRGVLLRVVRNAAAASENAVEGRTAGGQPAVGAGIVRNVPGLGGEITLS